MNSLLPIFSFLLLMALTLPPDRVLSITYKSVLLEVPQIQALDAVWSPSQNDALQPVTPALTLGLNLHHVMASWSFIPLLPTANLAAKLSFLKQVT